MKTRMRYAAVLIFPFAFLNKSVAQANIHLSNLKSPTQVNADLLPDYGSSHNLGAAGNTWKNIYLSDFVYLGATRFIAGDIIGNGAYNTAVGYKTMNANTTGKDNTANGYQALYSNTSGSANTAIGLSALYHNTKGEQNTALGISAGGNVTIGSYNTFLGVDAGRNITDGSYNTFLGTYANSGNAGHISNSTAIGSNAFVNSSNKVVIGSTSVASIGGYVGWTNFSDGRYKQNIKQNVPGLEFINKLTPITYTLNINAIETKLHEGQEELRTPDDKLLPNAMDNPIMKQAMNEKSQIVYTGLIAQDVEKAAKKLNYNFSGIDKPTDDQKSFYGLRYADFVVPLVKAVQELSASNDAKDAKIQEQDKKIDALIAMMQTLQQNYSNCNPCAANTSSNVVSVSDASLEQNVPNPFNHSTSISYNLPQKYTTAQIIITDKTGKILKVVNVSGVGKGKVNVDASILAAGAYNYSLVIDGKLIGTKQMVLTK